MRHLENVRSSYTEAAVEMKTDLKISQVSHFSFRRHSEVEFITITLSSHVTPQQGRCNLPFLPKKTVFFGIFSQNRGCGK